jgi:hypothetical protein
MENDLGKGVDLGNDNYGRLVLMEPSCDVTNFMTIV